jgi:L-lactate utilization protein LutB
MSCPTCFCLDVYDQWVDKVDNTMRCVEWDACFLLEFAEVALGGNFRRSRADRIRQFIGHNLSWGGVAQFSDSPVRYKCVGCGRCIRACPVHIDITEVASEIRGQ